MLFCEEKGQFWYLLLQNVHAEMYSLLIDTYIEDSTEKHKLLHAIDNCELVSGVIKRE